MTVDKIKEKILSDARAQAKQIDKEIAAKVKAIQTEQHRQEKDIEARAEEEAKRRAEDRYRKDIATAELELRKAVLARKQELIQEVFDLAYEQLLSMKEETYRGFLRDLLMKAVETGEEEVIFSPKDAKKMAPDILKDVNGRLQKDDRTGALRLSKEPREIQGGFILKREKQETNCSLGALFNAVREELEPRVAAVLFS
jgi:V/A-type H+-transporting ATPase subunit E